MELTKIRSLSDQELVHQEQTSAEQLFRLRFQVSLGQNDGVKKLRQLRKEIAQIKTVARERQLGVRGAVPDTSPAIEKKSPKTSVAKIAKKPAQPAKKSSRPSTKKVVKASAKKSPKASAEKGAGK